MIKCPYCTEERPTRSRLQTHVNQIHYLADTQPNRMDAVDAAVTRAEPLCPSTIRSGFNQTYRCPQVFGHSGDHGDPNSSPRWKDEHAEPVSSPQQREDLQAEWSRVGAGLDKAGQEMREMRAALDAVDERMRKLDAELTKPSVVRRATLNQVWDRLLDAGHTAAAREVMRMIERVVD